MRRLERFRGHFYNWYDTRRCAAARTEVRLVGRQRQPRRPSHRAGARRRGDGRPPAPAPRGPRRDRRRGVARSPVQPDRRCQRPATLSLPRECGEGRRRAHGGGAGAAARSGRVGRPTLRAPGPRRGRCSSWRPPAWTKIGERAVGGGGRLGGGPRRDGREPCAGRRSARHDRASPRPARGRGPGAGRRHGLRLPVRPDAQAAGDRLPRQRRHARFRPVRPARLGGPPGQLRGDRQGRRARVALVPAGPGAHPGRRSTPCSSPGRGRCSST